MNDDQKGQIEEWFAVCWSYEEVAVLYGDMLHEIKKQLSFMIKKLHDEEY